MISTKTVWYKRFYITDSLTKSISQKGFSTKNDVYERSVLLQKKHSHKTMLFMKYLATIVYHNTYFVTK